MRNAGSGVIQPFYESKESKAKGIRGRHDIRVVVVSARMIFSMIRELPADAPAADFVTSVSNMEKYGRHPQYKDISWLRDNVRRIPEIVTKVEEALRGAWVDRHAIFSIDFLCDTNTASPRIVEINSKPSQVWQSGDPGSVATIKQFQEAILDEFAELME